jgi:ketosteroid isomerase-like protein
MSRDGGEPVRFSGKYTIVWEKGKDGIWRMKVDMWNTRGKDEGTKEE